MNGQDSLQYVELHSQFRSVLPWLNEKLPSPHGHFLLHYSSRHRCGERSLGLSAVEDRRLLLKYAESLDNAYAWFRSHDWEPPAGADENNMVPVYVTRPENKTIDPATLSAGGFSSIWLRSLILAPSVEALLEVAEVDATHEVAHLFNHCHHPPVGKDVPWGWFDEASAVLAERKICGHLQESLRYGVYWCYRPENALNLMDQEGGGYLAAWFLKYLEQCLDMSTLVRDVWHYRDEDPWGPPLGPITILDRLIRQRERKGFQDKFEDYASTTYRCKAFDQHIHGRFGERTLTEWFRLQLRQEFSRTDPVEKLDPYACRYYRIDVLEGARQLDVEVNILPRGGTDNVRACVLLLHDDQTVIQREALECRGPNGALEGVLLKCSLNLTAIGAEHAVLIVTNVPPPGDKEYLDLFLIREYRVKAIMT